MKVDIRDSNYIWCEGKYIFKVGMITRIYVKYEENERYVRVMFLVRNSIIKNYLESKEEDVRIGS